MSIRNLRRLFIIFLVLDIIFIALYVVTAWYAPIYPKEHTYLCVKPQIQTVVTAYIDDSQGERPPHSGTYNVVVSNEVDTITCDILDVCSLVNVSLPTDIILRGLWGGCFLGERGDAGTNFYSGECDNDPCLGSYVFVMDEFGEVYSVCDVDGDGVIAEDGIENYDGYSGNSSEDIWNYCRSWFERNSDVIVTVLFSLTVFTVLCTFILLFSWLVLWLFLYNKSREKSTDETDDVGRE